MANIKKVKPKVLPQNMEAEQCVLGCMLLDNDICATIIGELVPIDFYSEAHKIIFNSMIEIFMNNKPIDFITVTDMLNSKAVLTSIGGVEYIASLTNAVPGTANYQSYIEIVKRDSLLRQLIKAGNDIIETSMESESRDDALAYAEKLVFSISQKNEQRKLTHIGDEIDNTLAVFQNLQENKGKPRGIPTGFFALDKILNGLQKSDLILLAARPSMGKTSFAMNIVSNSAMKGIKCAVFSLEMAKNQLTQRILCSIAKVDMKKSLSGSMNEEEWQAIFAAGEKIKGLEIYIDDTPSTNPYEILSKCRRIKKEMKGLDLVMIDYLQLMTMPKSSNADNRQQEISEFTRALKIAARELDVPVLVLSQLNRAVEFRKDHTPLLADLRESGSIEQDADIVMFINKMDAYPEYQGEKDIADIIIAKHRNGEKGTIQLKWRGEYTTFVNLTVDAKSASFEASLPKPN